MSTTEATASLAREECLTHAQLVAQLQSRGGEGDPMKGELVRALETLLVAINHPGAEGIPTKAQRIIAHPPRHEGTAGLHRCRLVLFYLLVAVAKTRSLDSYETKRYARSNKSRPGTTPARNETTYL